MLSLVAYGSSGESENESDNDAEPVVKVVTPASSKIDIVKPNGSSIDAPEVSKSPPPIVKDIQQPSGSRQGLHSKLPAPKTVAKELAEDNEEEESLALGSKLPAPKHHHALSLLDSPLMLPKDPKLKGKRGPVKILIPSLSDFPEDEDQPKAKKKIQPSAKGSGLFALLPPPKQGTIKEANRSLVPNAVTRKPVPAPVRKPPPKTVPQAVKRKHPESDPESDGENESADFFSLNKEDKLPEIPLSEVSSVAATTVYSNDGTPSYANPSSSYQQNDSYSGHAEYQYRQQYNDQATPSTQDIALPQANSGQDFIAFSGSGDLQLDDEAIKKLCGRRRREEIQIVDVSGDSIMPDQREWLTKQLTEEQPRSSSKSKLNGPSSQQKRKHQITYLAHIAKENELELKNQWANNRFTRKQTQSKYGF